MKRILTSILMAVGITGPFVSHLSAQGYRMVADVPFAFVADNSAMPAGQYDFSQWNAGSTGFIVRPTHGQGIMLQMANVDSTTKRKPSVTFACYGKECVLAKITVPETMTSYSVSRASIERRLHHTLGMASMLSVKLTAR